MQRVCPQHQDIRLKREGLRKFVYSQKKRLFTKQNKYN